MPQNGLSKLIRIATAVVIMVLAIVVEFWHFVPAFRFMNFLLVFLSSAILVSLTRGKTRDSLIALTSLLLGLTSFEGVATLMQHQIRTKMTDGWSVLRPEIGWGPQAEGVYHAEKTDITSNTIIYNADYTIDKNLLRHTASKSEGEAIVFFGDSFTFGDGVEDQETMPQRFSDRLSHQERVLNLAFTGYGPQQFLREMEIGLYDKVIGPKPKLFIFMTAAWHAERTSCKAYWTPPAPFYIVDDHNNISFKGQCNPPGPSLWFRQWRENSAAYKFLIEPYRHKLTHEDVEFYVRILERAIDLARIKYGVPVLIPYLTYPKEYLDSTGFTDELIMERLKKAGAEVTDVSLKEEENNGKIISIKGDGHPTPLAHDLRARLLIDYIRARMPGILAAPASQDSQNESFQSSSKAPL